MSVIGRLEKALNDRGGVFTVIDGAASISIGSDGCIDSPVPTS
jgi:hypothetical protein